MLAKFKTGHIVCSLPPPLLCWGDRTSNWTSTFRGGLLGKWVVTFSEAGGWGGGCNFHIQDKLKS